MAIWYPEAALIPGPAWKQNYFDCSARIGNGAVVHSMEGRWQAALARLDSSEQASWHFSLTYEGALMQHYPLEAVCWHAGGYANRRWFGIECEGRAGEPLTDAQVVALVKLLKWAAKERSWSGFVLKKDTGTLHEHNWYMATACPSGRIPWTMVAMLLSNTFPRTLTYEECLRINAQFAYHFNRERNADDLVSVLRYVYTWKGWPWPI